MATRNIKLLGTAYSTDGNVSITVNFNGTQVFSGEVPTTNGTAPAKETSVPVELATWATTTDVTGDVAMSIEVTNGTIIFQDLFGDQVISLDEDENGVRTVVDGAYVVLNDGTAFAPLNINSAESDGKNNVEIEGVAVARDLESTPDAATGEWMYKIEESETLTCSFYIDPGILTSVPTPA